MCSVTVGAVKGSGDQGLSDLAGRLEMLPHLVTSALKHK